MQKDSAPLHCHTWLLIEHRRTQRLQLLQSERDIINFERNMVQALTTPLQKLHQTGVRRGGFDQLNLTPARTPQGEKCNADLLSRNLFNFAWSNTQHIPIKAQRLLNIAHNNSYMVDF